MVVSKLDVVSHDLTLSSDGQFIAEIDYSTSLYPVLCNSVIGAAPNEFTVKPYGPSCTTPSILFNVVQAQHEISPMALTLLSSSPRAQNIEIPVNDLVVETVKCQWGSGCGADLTDLSTVGIGHHLKEIHFDKGHAWSNGRRTFCLWSHNNESCGKEMFHESLPKHIASVHLKSVSRKCPICERAFSRGDSLNRHIKKACCAGFCRMR